MLARKETLARKARTGATRRHSAHGNHLPSRPFVEMARHLGSPALPAPHDLDRIGAGLDGHRRASGVCVGIVSSCNPSLWAPFSRKELSCSRPPEGKPPPPIQDLLAKGFLTILAQASPISYCMLARRRCKRNLEKEQKFLHTDPCFPPGSRQGGASLSRGGIVSRAEFADGRSRQTDRGCSAAAWPPNARRFRRR